MTENSVNDDLSKDFGMDEEHVQDAAAQSTVDAVPDIDPEDDRENWPEIHIDIEDEKPNFEFLAVHGTKKNGKPFSHELQVMRGMDVPVPPSIVYMLRNAVAARYVSKRDPKTGSMTLERSDRSSIPWRLVKSGKYC